MIGFHWLARIEPLDETPGLVRIISRGEIGPEKWHDLSRKIIESNPGERVFRLGRFLFELGDDAGRINRDAAVFFDRLEIADVISRQRRFGVFRIFRKIDEGFAKKIVTRNNDQIVVARFSSRIRTRLISPIAPSLSESSVDPSSIILSASPDCLWR